MGAGRSTKKKRVKLSYILLCTSCTAFGVTAVVFAKSKGSVEGELSSVNPYMALVATIMIAVVGLVIFIKRNTSDKE